LSQSAWEAAAAKPATRRAAKKSHGQNGCRENFHSESHYGTPFLVGIEAAADNRLITVNGEEEAE
jgi:hypothetical protein